MLIVSNNLKPVLSHVVHRHASCWCIERRDGVKILGTNHDCDLTVNHEVYRADTALTVSAFAKRENLNAQDRDIKAVLDDSRITNADLLSGRYRQAKVTQLLVDWKVPWAGPLETTQFWIIDTSFNDSYWEASVEGLTRYLNPDVGRLYTRDERLANFGSSVDARGDLNNWTEDGTVQAVTGLANFGLGNETIDGRRRVRVTVDKATGYANWVAGYYDGGQLRVTDGANAGIAFDILKTTLVAVYSSTFDVQVKLTREMPSLFAVSDNVELIAGYSGSFSEAKTKFGNVEGFGGFPYIPGNDAMMRAPNAK